MCKQLETVKDRLIKILMTESQTAWEFGMQNSSGPISEVDANKVIESAIGKLGNVYLVDLGV